MDGRLGKKKIIVRGAGEMASGVIYRLFAEGYNIIALEQTNPCCIRRYVCFAEAIYAGEVEIEGVRAKSALNMEEANELLNRNIVPLLVDPLATILNSFKPDVFVDGRMLKKNIDTSPDMAELVVGLGPGFYPGINCHLAVETNRGPNLGRVFADGPPQEDTAVPAPVQGFTTERLLRSPVDGVIRNRFNIGDIIREGDIVTEVGGLPVKSRIGGVLRGICHDGLKVLKNQKIGDIDPRGEKAACYKISDKVQAIAAGVMDAIKSFSNAKVYRQQ